MRLFDFLRLNLLKVVEYSRSTSHTLAVFNTTFILLIPKLDNPSYFEQFNLISLCNSIYKIIAKIIVRRLKDILSDHILPEQFGLLQGRQINEAIGLA
jgi:hypothetical protein